MRESAAGLLRALGPTLAALLALSGCSKNEGVLAPRSSRPALLIGFMSNRPPSTTTNNDIYFYDVARQQAAYLPPNVNTYYDEGPFGLSGDGRWMAMVSTRIITGSNATVFLYETKTAALRVLRTPGSGLYFGAFNPALSYDGSRMAFHYRISGDLFGLTVALLDVKADTIIPTPSLHLDGAGEFDPALSGDGKLIAFTSNRYRSLDVLLYSVPGDSLVPTPDLDSDLYSDTGVSLSADARYVAFHSNRPGGMGLFDVYVYDRQTSSFLPMPDANTALSELNPSLSPDGRYVAYTTENDGAGDVRLYDLQARKPIPLPGCNDSYFPDRFPSLAERP